jgi:hypothetical protein
LEERWTESAGFWGFSGIDESWIILQGAFHGKQKAGLALCFKNTRAAKLAVDTARRIGWVNADKSGADEDSS